MLIDIFVVRGAGTQRGPDIINQLIGSIPVAIQLGRNRLDREASGMQEVNVTALFRTGVRAGQVGKFYDVTTGESWVGKIAGVTHSYNDGELITQLQVEKPTKFY